MFPFDDSIPLRQCLALLTRRPAAAIQCSHMSVWAEIFLACLTVPCCFKDITGVGTINPHELDTINVEAAFMIT